MFDFVFKARPARVVFGAGRIAALGEEVARLGAKRALILSTPVQRLRAEDAARRLGGAAAGIFDQAVMHVPIETAEAARAEAKRVGADCCVAIGGGSTTGLAKAISVTAVYSLVLALTDRFRFWRKRCQAVFPTLQFARIFVIWQPRRGSAP